MRNPHSERGAASQPARRLAIIYLPGLFKVDGADELTAIGRKLAISLDKNAAEGKPVFEAVGEYAELRGEKVNICHLQRREPATNHTEPVADLFLMDYRPGLLDRYRQQSLFGKCMVTSGALIAALARMIRYSFRPRHEVKLLRDRLQAVYALMGVMLMGVYLATLALAVIKVADEAWLKTKDEQAALDEPPRQDDGAPVLITNAPPAEGGVWPPLPPLTNVVVLTNHPPWTNLPVWTNLPLSTNWEGGVLIPGTNWAVTNWWKARTNDGTIWPWMPLGTNDVILTNSIANWPSGPLGTNTVILTNFPPVTNWPAWNAFPETNWPGGMVVPPTTNVAATNLWFTNFPGGGTSGPPPIIVPGTNWPLTNWGSMTNWGPWGPGGIPPPPKKSGWEWFKQKVRDFFDWLLGILVTPVAWVYEWSARLIVIMTAAGILMPGRQKRWEALVQRSEEMVAFTNYFSFGQRRAEITGALENYLEKVMEAGDGKYDRYIILSYSFGSIVALDTLFPAGGTRAARLERVQTLVTIGSPHDFVLTFWPGYFAERNPAHRRPGQWINVYSPIDLLASQFDTPEKREAKLRPSTSQKGTLAREQAPTLELSYREGLPEQRLGFWSWIFLMGLHSHSMYWSHTEDGERNCFDELAPHLFPSTVGDQGH